MITKSKTKKIILAIVILISILVVAGAIAWPFLWPIKVTWSSLPYKYIVHGTYIEIYSYTGDEEQVIIPDRIWFRPVKELKNQFISGVFEDNEIIRTVYMPDTIEKMDKYTFSGCINLESIRLSNALKKIPYDAFNNCISLKCIEIPEGVELIDSFAFCNCSTLEKVIFPESLQTIGTHAFSDCEKLEHIEIPAGVQKIDGNIFERTAWIDKQKEEFVVVGKNVLICYQGNASVVEVPEGVEYIGYRVFEHRPELIHLVLPESLKECDSSMALQCENLKYVTIKNSDMELPYDSLFGTAFETCNPDLTLVGEKGSTAEAYAKEHGYNFLESIPEE